MLTKRNSVRGVIMSKILLATIGVLALMVAGVAELGACGNKFLVAARGGPQLSYSSVADPARILVYWEADPENDSGDDSILEASLKDAGHSVAIVKDSQDLYREAASGGFEIIMMEVGAARQEQPRLEGVAPRSTILPILHLPTRSEYSAAKKEFGQAIKTPSTMKHLLGQIDKARPASR
jgi:hypothetical protein